MANPGTSRLQRRQRRGAGPARERRSQADRRAATRARILAAVFACIEERGLAGATAVEVTRRAGVTWGAVQHHFGGKDGLLIAAVEDSFDRFARRLEPLPSADAPLALRVNWFVERAWTHFRSREYRSAFEILFATLGREDLTDAADSDDWRGAMFRAWARVWARIFADSKLPRARRVALQHYTISVLSGLASTAMLAGRARDLPNTELRFLEDTLSRELRAT